MNYLANTKGLTKEDCIRYLENWISDLNRQLSNGNLDSPLLKEQIDYLTKTVEVLRNSVQLAYIRHDPTKRERVH